MPRYFLQFAYDGTAYHGWQIQENAHSVQAEINRALSVSCRQSIEAVGAGRTDTGVHALEMVAHFDSAEPIANLNKLQHQLNGLLPKDIVVNSVIEVDPAAHARFDAVSRSYEYRIVQQPNPFLLKQAYFFPKPLDFSLMNEAAKRLKEVQDFTSFSKLHSDTKTNDCTVTEAVWKQDGAEATFYINANRFLRNMVRAIVGTLLEVGLKKMTLDDFDKVVEAKERSKAGFSVPAHGLYLTQVSYPDNYIKQ
jgi:tRNA pseudouridine38-40 synthase